MGNIGLKLFLMTFPSPEQKVVLQISFKNKLLNQLKAAQRVAEIVELYQTCNGGMA